MFSGSVCTPSTLRIRVRIPLKPAVSSVKGLKRTKIHKKRPGLVHLQKYVGQCKIVSHWFILVTTLYVCVTEIKVHEKFSNNVSTFGRQKILIKKMEITACGHVPFFSLAEWIFYQSQLWRKKSSSESALACSHFLLLIVGKKWVSVCACECGGRAVWPVLDIVERSWLQIVLINPR